MYCNTFCLVSQAFKINTTQDWVTMKIKELTETTDHKVNDGQKSAIPGNGPISEPAKKKRMAKQKIEVLLQK